MMTQVLEGTLADIQRELDALELRPDTFLHVEISESNPPSETGRIDFANASRRNGIILIPRRPESRPVTIDLVDELSED